MKPFESKAMEEVAPTLPLESIVPDGIAPPELVGVAVGDMAVLLVKTNQSGLYEISGASSFTVMLTVAEDEPPLLFAQMVNVLSVIKEVGVPQMVPLLVPKFRPLGSAGEIAHEVIVPEPVSVALSGKSVEEVLMVSTSVLGE